MHQLRTSQIDPLVLQRVLHERLTSLYHTSASLASASASLSAPSLSLSAGSADTEVASSSLEQLDGGSSTPRSALGARLGWHAELW